MTDPTQPTTRIFELQLERAYQRALAVAALAREPWEAPSWVTDRLEEIEQALAGAGRSPAMARLAERADLEPAAEELLWTLAAASVEARAHAHLLAAFGSDARRGLCAGSYAALARLDGEASRELIDVLDHGHALFRHRLLEPLDDRLSASTPLAVPRRVIDHLSGRNTIDGLLAGCGGVLAPPPLPRLDDRQRDVLARLREALGSGQPAVLIVEGPVGAGRRGAIALAAAALGRSAVAFDAARAPWSSLDRQRALAALHRDALLRGAVPVVANADDLTGAAQDGDAWRRSLESFAGQQTGVTVVTAREGGFDLSGDIPVVRFAWGLANHATRRAMWSDFFGGVSAELDGQLGQFAHRYRLGPGGIERTLRSARILASRVDGDASLTPHDVVLGVRSNTAERLLTLARRIEVVESWEDLVLPDDAQEAVRNVIDRVRHGHRVYEEWGFKRRASRGTGVPVLFSGPPGTGKTMVAGLIARELDLELFQIDLSQVVSKWVGETEKNLGQVFEAAEAGHALLLFDEADALFAKRSTDVKGAQDRYANLEVNYLLQRIEAFAGMAILTTNLDTSIDKALKRRLAAHVVFYPPDEDERAELWRRMVLASDAPVDRDSLDCELLSCEFPDMSGAHIRNVVLATAFAAAAAGTPITQEGLLSAARKEYHSMGRVLSASH